MNGNVPKSYHLKKYLVLKGSIQRDYIEDKLTKKNQLLPKVDFLLTQSLQPSKLLKKCDFLN